MIPIPPELTESIIKSDGGTKSATSFDQTLAHIKWGFLGRLVDATGLELAGAEGGLQATQVPQHCTTSHRVTPVEMFLVSAAVAEHVEDKDLPVYVCDWPHHGDILNVNVSLRIQFTDAARHEIMSHDPIFFGWAASRTTRTEDGAGVHECRRRKRRRCQSGMNRRLEH
ncbi:hypothetical protein BDR06DRAFT_962875 [Suillus hirtellus]|nr:hypothetical protein BDR06DRAFT_962875 [Suillus hirtellus]